MTSLPASAGPSSSSTNTASSLFSTDDQRWEAVVSRDPRAEGHFLYCVLSTGIFCRPICPSRRPNRANVIFATTTADAIARGCRPCKRCKPEESTDPTEKRQSEAVERLRRALLGGEGADLEKVTVKNVAKEMGVSMWHLNRTFKKRVGCSPAAWARGTCPE